MTKTLRFKSSSGITATWRIGKTKDGKYKALSLSKLKMGKSPIPLDFAPFPMMDAVLGHNDFDTEVECERYLRSL